MENITSKVTSLFKPQYHLQRHGHGHGRDAGLPKYQPISGMPVGSYSPTLSRSSGSAEDTPRHQGHTTPSMSQAREMTRNLEFSSSSETLGSLGGEDMVTHLSPEPLRAPTESGMFNFSMKLPALKHFLSDFTLGFADGLTVPFALTAGLSSLGQTKTVIYAGMAEICAGSISMGIGGYLAAKGENGSDEQPESASADDAKDDEAQEEEKVPLHKIRVDPESPYPDSETERVVGSYLSPLQLPPYLRDQVIAHARLSSPEIHVKFSTDQDEQPQPREESQPPSAILSGLSISLGYLLGGILPLFPYFFVEKVTDGLAWSFGVCVLALFFFGFGKAYALGSNNTNAKNENSSGAKRRRMKTSIWEGLQMVILGSIAAGAAVVCVRAFESFAEEYGP
ncbi:VIT family domain containing protein [Rhypophila sp. PSN 637]